jgi:hypothetical protein
VNFFETPASLCVHQLSYVNLTTPSVNGVLGTRSGLALVDATLGGERPLTVSLTAFPLAVVLLAGTAGGTRLDLLGLFGSAIPPLHRHERVAELDPKVVIHTGLGNDLQGQLQVVRQVVVARQMLGGLLRELQLREVLLEERIATGRSEVLPNLVAGPPTAVVVAVGQHLADVVMEQIDRVGMLGEDYRAQLVQLRRLPRRFELAVVAVPRPGRDDDGGQGSPFPGLRAGADCTSS